jgi:hypothetical protein
VGPARAPLSLAQANRGARSQHAHTRAHGDAWRGTSPGCAHLIALLLAVDEVGASRALLPGLAVVLRGRLGLGRLGLLVLLGYLLLLCRLFLRRCRTSESQLSAGARQRT